ncbi:MAG: NUDIX domain-containing protein [Patescibacteria group bacterium]
MEILDIVNLNDQVIGQAPKPEIYQQLLCHRIVHILIFNDQGKMALQLRSAKVNFCPLHWSTAVGGHVQTGETYETAGLREYEEELGQQSQLQFLSKDLYQLPNRPAKFLATFTTKFNGPFKPDLEVVEKVNFFTLAEIQKMIASGEKFHPELLFILTKHFLQKYDRKSNPF